MKIERFHIYLADLGTRYGVEPGKIRPVVVVQTDLLNSQEYASTIVCPITSQVENALDILRVYINTKEAGLNTPSDILVDQIRAIDNHRIKRYLGRLNRSQSEQLEENLKVLILE